jgi:multiple sugar transport system substrate-binding protein
LEIVPFDSSRDVLSTQIAAGEGPDIIGPVGIGGSNAFYGQWLDLTPYIESANYDLSQFNKALIEFYQTEEGQVGLPFAVFPSGLFYQKAMFDEAGLNYPPSELGDPFVWPDGTEEEWNWDTLTKVAKQLTVDVNGLTPLDEGFDRESIVQIGYTEPWAAPAVRGTFWGAATPYSGEEGAYTAEIPASWEAAWRWWFDAVWGDEPFMANGALADSPEFGSGNVFNSGNAAMGLTQIWYTCCIVDAGDSWDVAAFPTTDGVLNGRMDADTFRIWKGTKNPEAAFKVLTYLLSSEAVATLAPAYGAMPARETDQEPFFATQSEAFPQVTNWDLFKTTLAYPDIPSAEAWMPNWNEAWDRIGTFGSLIQNDGEMDFDAELATLEADLTEILNK